MAKKLTHQGFRLRLVCEKCAQPCGDGYLIDRPQEYMAKFMPALKVGGERGGAEVGGVRPRGAMPGLGAEGETRGFIKG